jgi:hypothetical protein
MSNIRKYTKVSHKLLLFICTILPIGATANTQYKQEELWFQQGGSSFSAKGITDEGRVHFVTDSLYTTIIQGVVLEDDGWSTEVGIGGFPIMMNTQDPALACSPSLKPIPEIIEPNVYYDIQIVCRVALPTPSSPNGIYTELSDLTEAGHEAGILGFDMNNSGQVISHMNISNNETYSEVIQRHDGTPRILLELDYETSDLRSITNLKIGQNGHVYFSAYDHGGIGDARLGLYEINTEGELIVRHDRSSPVPPDVSEVYNLNGAHYPPQYVAANSKGEFLVGFPMPNDQFYFYKRSEGTWTLLAITESTPFIWSPVYSANGSFAFIRPGKSPLNSSMVATDIMVVPLGESPQLLKTRSPSNPYNRITGSLEINDRGMVLGQFEEYFEIDGQDVFTGVLARWTPEGTTPNNPALPDDNCASNTADYQFCGETSYFPIRAIPLNPPTTEFRIILGQYRYYDPELAIGYQYTVAPGGANFASVTIPFDYGDGEFSLYLRNHNTGEFEDSGYTIFTGDTFDFIDKLNRPDGLAEFVLRGIELDAEVDPDDPEGFVTGLIFIGEQDDVPKTITVNFGMTPIRYDTDAQCEVGACIVDTDNDTINDDLDNCPHIANTDQANLDGDEFGDLCDTDIDGDSITNEDDNCPLVANEDQTDADSDGLGAACDDMDTILSDINIEYGGAGWAGTLTIGNTQHLIQIPLDSVSFSDNIEHQAFILPKNYKLNATPKLPHGKITCDSIKGPGLTGFDSTSPPQLSCSWQATPDSKVDDPVFNLTLERTTFASPELNIKQITHKTLKGILSPEHPVEVTLSMTVLEYRGGSNPYHKAFLVKPDETLNTTEAVNAGYSIEQCDLPVQSQHPLVGIYGEHPSISCTWNGPNNSQGVVELN